MSIDHGCRWVIEKIVPQKVKIHDLGIPDVSGRYPIYALEQTKDGESKIYYLHDHFTWQQLSNSQGLRTAEAAGFIRTVEKIPPTPVNLSISDNSSLTNEIATLKGLVELLVANQASAAQQIAITPEMLKALSIGEHPASQADNDAAAMAAIKAFGQTGGNIESNLDLSGNRSSVKSDASDIASSLSQMNFKDEDEDE